MDEDTKSSIDRIDSIAAAAQTAWLSLLGVLAFITITLLSLKHSEIILESRLIELPIVRIEVPTLRFLVLGAVVATVLYGNLHLLLIKLWQAFQHAPHDAKLQKRCAGEQPGAGSVWHERKLADAIKPWIINDYALSLKENCTPRDEVRSIWRQLIVWFTVWWAGPLVIAWMWHASLLARGFGASAAILLCLIVTCAAGALSWFDAHRRLKLIAHDVDFRDWDGHERFPGHAEYKAAREARDGGRFALAAAAIALIACGGYVLTAHATGGPGSAPLAAAMPAFDRDIVVDRENLAGLPSDWEGAVAQREEFRAVWCGIREVQARVCGNVPADTVGKTNILIMERRSYCKTELRKQGVAGSRQCTRFFDELDKAFDVAWAEVRKERLRQLESIDLSGRDLSAASAHLANLTSARLERTNLSGADLHEAALEGAQLIDADLAGATAFYGIFRLADLTRARLDGANLVSANFEGAVLQGALLRGTRLGDANLVAADLRGADLRDADLHGARLYRTLLDGALLDGANLQGAVGLTQAQLDGALGSPETKFTLPRRIIDSQIPIDRPFKVWDCWPAAPKWTEVLLANRRLSEAERDAVRARVCPAGTIPGATGTTVPLVATARAAPAGGPPPALAAFTSADLR